MITMLAAILTTVMIFLPVPPTLYQIATNAAVVLQAPAEAETPKAVALSTPEQHGAEENAQLDVDAWQVAFDGLWNSTHGEAFAYTRLEPAEGTEYPTLLLGWINDALYVEIYYAVTDDVYWLMSTLYNDAVPEGEEALYRDYFHEAVLLGLKAQFAGMTDEEMQTLDEEIRDIAARLVAGEIAEDDAYVYYGENTYIGVEYNEQEQMLGCFVGF